MRRSRITFAVLALVGLLAACGGSESSTSSSAQSTVAAQNANASAPAALQFAAPSVGGGAIDFTQFAGQPVVLWFWAPT